MGNADTQNAEEANRLYWNNEASVGEISTRLGISRRALYDLLEPQPSGISCSACGLQSVFVNRSALNSGVAKCLSCATETAAPAARQEPLRETVTRKRSSPVGANGQSSTRLALGSIALMGVVIGAIATLLVTRRD